MGYTTRFKLSYTDNDPTTEAAILRFLCIKGLLADDDCFEIEPDGKHWIEFSNKWYESGRCVGGEVFRCAMQTHQTTYRMAQ